MLWVGITGNIGSGKSTVSKKIQEMGFWVLDADLISRQVTKPGQRSYKKIVDFFGTSITDSSGEINRVLLAEKVFGDSGKLRSLESFIHPEIQKEVQDQKIKLQDQGEKAAFYDIPLLFEKKKEQDFDKIIVVACSLEMRFERVKKRSNLSWDDFMTRERSQLSLDEKIKKADYVIDNEGSLESLGDQIKHVVNEILQIRS